MFQCRGDSVTPVKTVDVDAISEGQQRAVGHIWSQQIFWRQHGADPGVVEHLPTDNSRHMMVRWQPRTPGVLKGRHQAPYVRRAGLVLGLAVELQLDQVHSC